MEIWSDRIGRKVLAGNRTYFWLLPPTVYTLYNFVFTNPVVFSSIYVSYFFNPYVGYNDTIGYLVSARQFPGLQVRNSPKRISNNIFRTKQTTEIQIAECGENIPASTLAILETVRTCVVLCFLEMIA